MQKKKSNENHIIKSLSLGMYMHGKRHRPIFCVKKQGLKRKIMFVLKVYYTHYCHLGYRVSTFGGQNKLDFWLKLKTPMKLLLACFYCYFVFGFWSLLARSYENNA